MLKATLGIFNIFRWPTNGDQNLEDDSDSDGEINITDINLACLDHIFKYLSIEDLLNVADSCESLREAAFFTYTSKYKRMTLQLQLKNIQLSRRFPTIQTSDRFSIVSKFSISNLTVCLKFLRCFGHTLNELIIDYNGVDDRHCMEIDHYVNKYCAETLTEMKIHHARKHTMCRIQIPFSNVRYLQLSDCDLAQRLINFEKWFPRCFDLTFHGFNQFEPRKCKFRSWATIHINLEYHDNEESLEMYLKNIAVPLKSCSLSLLEISGNGWNFGLLQSISKYLQNTTSLTVYSLLDEQFRIYRWRATNSFQTCWTSEDWFQRFQKSTGNAANSIFIW